MSLQPDALGAVPADQGVAPEAIPADSPPAPEVPASPEPAGGETPAPAGEPEPGPIPYARFKEVNESRKTLEARLQDLQPIATIYDHLKRDPKAAQQFAAAVSTAMGQAGEPPVEGLDESQMTDTEVFLYRKVRELEGTLGQTVKTSEAAQDAVTARELHEAVGRVGTWAKDQGLPFNADQVFSAIDTLNVEGLLASGQTLDDLARTAFKVVAFDALPDVVKQKTYAEQHKKAAASVVPGTSRGGTVVERVSSVRDAVNVAWKKAGLPEP